MNNMFKIYKIINLINKKIYVGQTIRPLYDRFIEHCKPSNKSIKLRNAIQKYGKENFKIEIITICHTQNIAEYWEKYFIEQFNSIKNGYNIAAGGTAPMLGRKHTKESNEKNRISNLGKIPPNKGILMSENQKSKLVENHVGMTGKKHSQETRIKISNIHKGMKHTEDTKIKIKIARANQPSPVKGKTWKLVDGKRIYTEKN